VSNRFEKERGDAYSLAKKHQQDDKPEDHDIILRLLDSTEELIKERDKLQRKIDFLLTPTQEGLITPEVLANAKRALEELSQRPVANYITESELETLKKRVPLDEGQASSL